MTIYIINVTLLLDKFGDEHENYKHCTYLMKSVIGM
jgi:hypothetical protein